MSHMSRITTQIREPAYLLAALADLGFADKAELLPQPVQLMGYDGMLRPEWAEIVIRRQYVGRMSNDLGFAYDPATGTYSAIISDYDRSRFDDAWLARLMQRYAYHATIATLAAQGLGVALEERQPDGSIRLILQGA